MNLTLVFGLRTLGIASLVRKCRAIATHFHVSHNDKRKLKAIQMQQGATPKSISRCVMTRWCSFARTASSIWECHDALTIFFRRNKTGRLKALTTEEWDLLEQLVPLLTTFADVLEMMQGEEDATIGLVMESIALLKR